MTDTLHSAHSAQTPARIPIIEERLTGLPLLFDSLQLESLSTQAQKLIAQIDACLPQTQCGLCDHPDGCLPYATAIVTQHEPFNKCVPGGQPVTDALAQLLGQETLPAAPSKWKTDEISGRPVEVRAVIREADCIGCTKCIPACPVDAIVGTGKHMHTIFTDLCTGCELCLPPCPVDCIDLIEVEHSPTELERAQEQAHLRQRYHTHLDRVAEQMTNRSRAKPVVSMVEAKLGNVANQAIDIDAAEAKSTIAAAKLRTKIKKLDKQLSVRPNPAKQAERERLQAELETLLDEA
ncbi:RnfABCDGE type electron transport complex subunit B [Psychrobacter pygoscelis]|uniref:RnfABCDGE type electron transport complex subunit B n=1 Tax=Psychrobacter pygoscelis TaxID=2488563 RepID=UPI00103FB2C8